MMKNNSPGKPHAVLVPFPAQGHTFPMMQLASLLHTRGFFITFVNTEFNHRRLIRSKGQEWVKGFKDFQFETIPEGLPPSDRNATQDPATLCDSIRKNCYPVFRDLLGKLVSSVELPRISCIISDGVMSFAIKAGAEFGIEVFQLWTASACGFMGYLQYAELIKRGIIPFKDENFVEKGLLDTQIDWIPGMRNMRLEDMPSFVRTTDINDVMLNYLRDEAQNCLKASAIIFNTFPDLEHEVLDAITPLSPPIYTIGPLNLLSKDMPSNPVNSFRPSLWKDDRACLEWLDKQKENSVIYVNYGSVTLISEQHLKEFAWGLANSKHPFLWIVRPDVAMGESPILPKNFLEETKDRCFLTSWCPQDEVLSHPSVGIFLSHCGWNSTLESISAGVPMLCWPFFAEQQTNCRYVCMEWEMGLEVGHDVKREEIELLVRKAMETEKGKEMKAKALEWKRKAIDATREGGSSCRDFERLVTDIVEKEEKLA
ncbi:UDP-glucuronosyl and UDP-glucosyl transferase [Handroanthus impetiginosus]|uniref:7-deoxyloganetin glucosyltransferase n=1 Tax=Handroanthus impetiginosus TaxID=429701 RepID=A0A2G9GXE5_9LAMI|nr:UDP-glucuronosyl and UDP-glucosyl transferase [Handroanthus impetiginosus]